MKNESPADKAERLHEEARKLEDDELALKLYSEALSLDPDRPSTYYNIGLIYKYRNQWTDSFRYNERAVELRPDDEASNWNLAIAATALRDWVTARAVWNRLGMPIELGAGFIESNFGNTPVRLNPDDNGEVVWGRRIDPVRVRILNIPLPASGFRYGDIVLHDGAAVGHRISEDREYPVFNVLELFENSRFSTYELELAVDRKEDVQALAEICDELQLPFEDWTASVNYLCKQCSEGTPHKDHDRELEEPNLNRYRVAMAAVDEKSIRQTLEKWENKTRKAVEIACTLSATMQ